MQRKGKAGLGAYMAAPLMALLGFTIASLVFIFVLGDASPVPVFVIFAIIQFVMMTLYGLLSGRGKTVVRLISMFLIGLFILVLAGILGRNNFQLEGFLFYLFSGSMSGVIVHLVMAKILGPIFFSRNWCSWGCWTAMFLDLLPYKTDTNWKSKGAANLRYVHFAFSVLIVAVLFFGLRFTIIHVDPEALKQGMGTQSEMIWFLAGNLLYYAIGITMAISMKDNRAFCKYLCPLTVFLKTTNRVTLLRIKGDKESCTSCESCVSQCPMSIEIPKYVTADERVKSTECILCMNCIATCPEGSLKTSVGFDYAGTDHLR